MLKTIQSALQIRKELPDAIGYDTYGPISFPVPNEFRKLLDSQHEELESINLMSIRVDNYSSKVQKDIRVLYSGSFLYQPKLKFHRRDIAVKFESKSNEKEIEIVEIPPNESVSIEIFYPSNDFEVVQVLSGDQEITNLMQKLAEARRYPELARLKLISIFMLSFVALAAPVAGYFIWEKTQEAQQIKAAYSEFSSCSASLMKNPPENDKKLERKFNKLDQRWKNYILSSNKVYTFEKLKLKDEIIWCDPNQP